ncbi:MAG: phospholipase D-like domain-containing protein [Candidatus Anstonellales archaeon]
MLVSNSVIIAVALVSSVVIVYYLYKKRLVNNSPIAPLPPPEPEPEPPPPPQPSPEPIPEPQPQPPSSSSSSMSVYHVYDNQVLQRDLDAIANAKQYVKISTYLLELANDPAKSAAYKLGQALQQAKRNGAIIQIVFSNDALTSKPRPWHAYTVDYLKNVLGLEDLTNASSSVRSAPSVSGYVIASIHSKNIVTESYVRAGSTNLNMNGYTYNLEDTIQIENPRADQSGAGARIHDAALAYANTYFVEKRPIKINSNNSNNNSNINFITGDSDIGKYWTSVIDRLKSSTCKKAYFSTYAYNANNTMIQQVVQAMIDAKRRGVDVKLVADINAKTLVDHLNNAIGIVVAKVIKSPYGNINHSKLIYIEDERLGRYALIGSQNFDSATAANSGISISSSSSSSSSADDLKLNLILDSIKARFDMLWSL